MASVLLYKCQNPCYIRKVVDCDYHKQIISCVTQIYLNGLPSHDGSVASMLAANIYHGNLDSVTSMKVSFLEINDALIWKLSFFRYNCIFGVRLFCYYTYSWLEIKYILLMLASKNFLFIVITAWS